jgi:hypothetical protein
MYVFLRINGMNITLKENLKGTGYSHIQYPSTMVNNRSRLGAQ